MGKTGLDTPQLLILNQWAGPMTWELAEDAAEALGCVALLTGHPDTLAKGSSPKIQLFSASPYNRGSFFQRAWSWLIYVCQAFLWLWKWPRDIPILLFSNPPILCWLGWLMKKLRGQHYSVMVHDIYPDVLVNLSGYSEQHLLIRIWSWFNQRGYENAEVVMTLGEHMAAHLEKQFNSKKTTYGKIEVVYPWVDTEKIKPIPKDENWFAKKYDQVDKITVMYAGNMGLGHDMETMLSAARLLRDDERFHFMFIGMGPKWPVLEQLLADSPLPNVTLLGWQPEEHLPDQLACADFGLVSLETGLTGLAIPSKAIYMLAAGAGMLALGAPGGELDMLAKYGCGVVIPPGEPDLLAFALKDLAADQARIQNQARSTAEAVFARKGNSSKVVRSAIQDSIN